MAIAFRSVGATLKADTSTAGPNQSVALPPGHVSGDYLLLFVVTDDITNMATEPAGWTKLANLPNSTATQTPYYAPPRLKIYYRFDNGSLGSTVPLTFSSAPWPNGSPWVLAITAAYSGLDPASPLEQGRAQTITTPDTALALPQATTTTANDWIISFRAASGVNASTYTNSVATDTERLDDSAGNELSAALYDSGAVPAGAQAVRTLTASQPCDFGSTLITLALKSPASSGLTSAVAGEGDVSATAYAPAVATEDGPWDSCDDDLPVYRFAIDWSDTASTDVTNDIVSSITVTYGRDQERQLAPGAVGSAAFTLTNTDRVYSPENPDGPLYGDLDPARTMRASATWNGQTYPLFTGRVDDYTVKTDFTDRTVDLTFLDGLGDLSGNNLSTGVYTSKRTGYLIDAILTLAGWTGGRDIDMGASVVRYWWVDGTDALTAIQDLVKSEGPPAVAYVAPDGTFVFRDRHHRIRRQDSITEQAVLYAGPFGECDGQDVPQGALSIARPFVYAHGWRDIANSVSFSVDVRVPSAAYEPVWQDTSTYVLATGQSVDLMINSTDPFLNALDPVPGTDILTTGTGTLSVTLSRHSGTSAHLVMRAVGGPVTVISAQVRAKTLTVQQTVRVSMQDSGSISRHGERSYPNDAPWASPEDARAIAIRALLYYAERRPTAEVRLVSSDPAHYLQVLQRTVSDRVRIVNGEMRLDNDFFVERVSHTIQRTGGTGRPPVHAVVLGCEKDLPAAANPFTFDMRGAGFDQGVFDPLQTDSASSVFVFDDPVQGLFDSGRYGT